MKRGDEVAEFELPDQTGTARSLTPAVQDLLEKRVPEIAEGTAMLHGATAKVKYRRGYPVLKNHAAQTDFAARVAGEIAGQDKVDTDMVPVMGAEDFSFMLNARPGAFIFIGNGLIEGLLSSSTDECLEFFPTLVFSSDLAD